MAALLPLYLEEQLSREVVESLRDQPALASLQRAPREQSRAQSDQKDADCKPRQAQDWRKIWRRPGAPDGEDASFMPGSYTNAARTPNPNVLLRYGQTVEK